MSHPGRADDFLPVEPFLAIVEQAVVELGSLAEVVARIEGIHPGRAYGSAMYRRLTSWRTGVAWGRGQNPVRFVSWPVADRIVLGLLDADAWHCIPELAALYESEQVPA